jgi:hypothetical protein
MLSVVLNWVEINEYLATIGPGLGRPPRPASCPACAGTWVWFDGWRTVFCVVLADGTPYRFDAGLAMQRVKCAACGCSWPLRPPFLYPHRTFEPDINEAAALAYLSEETATYAQVAEQFDCSARSVWRWVGWAADLAEPAALVAAAVRVGSEPAAATVIPRAVPGVARKGQSQKRRHVLVRALQVLGALAVLARAQLEPPADWSPLRWWLLGRWLRWGQLAYVTRSGLSPPVPDPGSTPID